MEEQHCGDYAHELPENIEDVHLPVWILVDGDMPCGMHSPAYGKTKDSINLYTADMCRESGAQRFEKNLMKFFGDF